MWGQPPRLSREAKRAPAPQKFPASAQPRPAKNPASPPPPKPFLAPLSACSTPPLPTRGARSIPFPRYRRVQVKCSTQFDNGLYHLNAHRRTGGRAVPYLPGEIDFLAACPLLFLRESPRPRVPHPCVLCKGGFHGRVDLENLIRHPYPPYANQPKDSARSAQDLTLTRQHRTRPCPSLLSSVSIVYYSM